MSVDDDGWLLDFEVNGQRVVLREEDVTMLFAAIGPVMLHRLGVEWGKALAQGQMREAGARLREVAGALAYHADRLEKP